MIGDPPCALQPSDSWRCECGEKHSLGGYVAAHWDEVLTHTCEKCDRVHELIKGWIELKK